MKSKVLSNVIDYAISNDIKNIDYLEKEITKIMNEGPTSYAPTSGVGFNKLPKGIIWGDIVSKLGFDTISIHLLENFSDTIESEDYRSASAMKKEISDRWTKANEEFFWDIGSEYIATLKSGVSTSDSLNYLSSNMTLIEQAWESGKTDNLEYVISELKNVMNNMTSHPVGVLVSEFIHFMESPIDDPNFEHPMSCIECIIEYFKLLED